MEVKNHMNYDLIVQCSILCVFCYLHHCFSLPAQDINECESDNLNDCDGNADCIDTIGSYNCSCISGYEGDGFNCTGYTSVCGAHLIANNVVPMLLMCDLQLQADFSFQILMNVS